MLCHISKQHRKYQPYDQLHGHHDDKVYEIVHKRGIEYRVPEHMDVILKAHKLSGSNASPFHETQPDRFLNRIKHSQYIKQ